MEWKDRNWLDRAELMPPNAVTQTRFGDPEGNCTEACLATLFNCGIEDVPNMYEAEKAGEDNWLAVIARWTWQQHKLWPIIIRDLTVSPYGYFLVGGESERGLPHCTVGYGYGDKWGVVHDPHPDRVGLNKKIDDITIFQPALWAGWGRDKPDAKGADDA